MKLYECTADIKAALDAHFDSEQERADTLEAVIGQFEVKAQAVIAYMLNVQAQADACAAHIKTVQARKAALDNNAERIKAYLIRNMEAADIPEICADDGTFSAKLRSNPPSVKVEDAGQIPNGFWRETVKTEPDKTAIKAAIQNGETVPGAKLERNKSIRIC